MAVRKVRKRLINDDLSSLLTLPRILSKLLGFKDLQDLLEVLKKEAEEAMWDDFSSNFLRAMLTRFEPNDVLNEDLLKQYDVNIKSHFDKVNARRNITLKFYQYAALMLTEIYLDLYFKHKSGDTLEDFVNLLNNERDKLNELIKQYTEPYTIDDVHKLCYWMATGSGKTLIMHMNILQFKHYAEKYSISFNNIYLITPNEDLSKQHIKEFSKSGIDAKLLDKTTQRYKRRDRPIVYVIDINKIKDQTKQKTLSYESFGKNNLILVDEGHKGTISGESWIKYRQEIAKEGFTFEYSATFVDVLKKDDVVSSGEKYNVSDYKKTIIMDYSYKYFHKDGYGKDYFILNAPKNTKSDYLIMAALLEYFQQKLIYDEYRKDAHKLNFEDPLMLLVGSTVLGSKKAQKQQEEKIMSDIRTFIHFLTTLKSKKHLIEDLLEKDILIDGDTGKNIVKEKLSYLLNKYRNNYDELMKDMLDHVFYTSNFDSPLKLVNIKDSEGEIGLKFGDSPHYFGLIYIGKGNDTELLKDPELKPHIGEPESMKKDLFKSLNESTKEKPINILIGARKFVEGWDNYRISTILLMNFGKSKGASAIQLFGRGVRLRGYGGKMKRFDYAKVNVDFDKKDFHKYYSILETLNVYGINANYIERFRKEIESEVELRFVRKIEVKKNPEVMKLLEDEELFIVEENREKINKFKETPLDINKFLNHVSPLHTIKINLYDKISTLTSNLEVKKDANIKEINKNKIINDEFFEIVNWNKIIKEIRDFLRVKGYYNVMIENVDILKNILRFGPFEFIGDEREFTVLGDPEHMTFNKLMELRRKLERIYTYALIKFFEKSHNYERKNIKKLYDLKTLDFDKIPLLEKGYYEIEINTKFEEFVESNKLKEILEEIKRANIIVDLDELKANRNEQQSLYTQLGEDIGIEFKNHMYRPLLIQQDSKIYSLSPPGLNKGEVDFVNKLKEYLQKLNNKNDFKLVLLRNDVGNFGFQRGEYKFYPDFIMWLIENNKQKIVFLDPKGLGKNIDTEKLALYKEIKDIEKKIKEESEKLHYDIELYYFTLSTTHLNDISNKEIKENPLKYGVIDLNKEECMQILFDQIREK